MNIPFVGTLAGSAVVKARFLLVGGAITVFDIAFCTVLSLRIPPTVAYCISFVVAVSLRFCLDRYFTFRSRGQRAVVQLAKYFLSCCVTLVAGMLAFSALRAFGSPPVVAKTISVFPVTVLGYILFRFFVFGGQSDAQINEEIQWSEGSAPDRA